MTIAISLKVNDGVVLAADSAATLHGPDGNVAFVWNNANKIINLLKGSPIGFISWGAGGVGNAGLETLMKDLRRRFAGHDPDHVDWKIDRHNYNIAEIAARVREFLFDELYAQTFPPGVPRPELGCMVAGYSSGQMMADQFEINLLKDGSCPPPREVCAHDHSPNLSAAGQPEAIWRLVRGFDSGLADVLQDKLGVPPDEIGPATQVIAQALGHPILAAPMPIQDAIELADFLVDLTIRYARFRPGASTVGGPIEIAAITKHEGFKWIRRKYYYRREFNPEEVQDAD